MCYLDRQIATSKREAEWEIDDNVPFERLTEGCKYCDRGWAHGPGIVYKCQCNETEGVIEYSVP